MPKEIKGKEMSILMVTKQGVVKKVDAKSFHDVRRSGLISIKLQAGDELSAALFVMLGDEVIMSTAEGQSIRFAEKQIRQMGRTAGGVRAMRLGKGDSIVGTDVIKTDAKNPRLLVVSANGYGKQTELSEYKTQNRGGSGIITMKVTDKTGQLITSRVVTDESDEVVAISKKSQVIRTHIAEIATLGRSTQGVRIMKLREGDSLASITCL